MFYLLPVPVEMQLIQFIHIDFLQQSYMQSTQTRLLNCHKTTWRRIIVLI